MMNRKGCAYKSGVLYVVSTPIGNLEDITYRAVRVLGEVDIILAEDTRRCAILLNSLGIVKRKKSLHSYNERRRLKMVMDYLRSGKSVALITESGTPAISDPGSMVLKKVIEGKIRVEIIPGPTAFLPALLLSALRPQPFLFYGFLPSTPRRRRRVLRELEELPYTMIFYESPHRIIQSLREIRNVLGSRIVSLSRELTKLYEETIRGKVDDVLKELEANPRKGEMVIVVEGKSKD